MQHNKYNEIYTLIDNNINVLLTGEAGAGKTTIIRNIATALNLKFYSIAMTKQTTLNTLLGFISTAIVKSFLASMYFSRKQLQTTLFS